MRKIPWILLSLLTLSGCQLEKQWYYPLQVSLQDNQPCFAVPADSVSRHDSLQNRGIIVSQQTSQQWDIVWTSPDILPLPALQPGRCVTYPQAAWQVGNYAVMMGVSLNHDRERRKYTHEFSLAKTPDGRLILRP
ncbi:hypothetical protein KH388_20155 [Serratia rubidaea]|nr:hypothetical protein [Serratia rubidaea]